MLGGLGIVRRVLKREESERGKVLVVRCFGYIASPPPPLLLRR